ncbi:hypothetical protein G210_0266 [Candida maltosa Xu316]|uniref:Serine hydrolase domain-containing protein n=1 Tax=Candida maltosa (strain Xu316) TaxID=1245528 RepID=M3JAC8_CANMX|nr:hypothetical protein G210_0266 [Candida maltosa Xu316]
MSKKILCLPGYLQNGSTFAAKSSGLRKLLTKKLNCQLDYIDPCHKIESWREFSFPIAATPEESDKTWEGIVSSGNNVRWFEHKEPGVNHGLEDSIKYIVNHIKENGPYDGIIGFSQGALMCEFITNSIKRLLPSHPDFKVSLSISGFYLTEPADGNLAKEHRDEINDVTDLDEYKKLVRISPDVEKYSIPPEDLQTQVLMVFGESDNIVAPIRARYVSTFYKSPKLFPHDGAHYVPNKKDFLQPIVKVFDEALNEKPML